jgi:hypothetical protein
MKAIRNKAKANTRNQQLMTALSNHFKSSDLITLDGTPYKARELQQLLQDHVDAQKAADAITSKWHTAVTAARAQGAKVDGVLPNLRTFLINAYGASSQIVADFGFTPKARATTIEAQATGVLKRAATRKARGTMGKKQKSKITGVVTPATTTTAPDATVTSATGGSETSKPAATA